MAEREAAIVATLQAARPDMVVLTESWAKGGDSQCARLAGPLDLPYHTFSGVAADEDEAALSGVAVMSRWPILRESSLTFGSARVQFAALSGPRGLIQVYGLVMDAWWFDESRARQDAVRALLTYVNEAQDKWAPLIVCGDFNADPDSDEIRMLTGRTTAPAPGLSFCDAWEVAACLARATRGPTTIPGPPSSCGLTAGSITSSPPLRALAAPVTRYTPPYWAPTALMTPTPLRPLRPSVRCPLLTVG